MSGEVDVEMRKIKVYMWLIAACRKYKRIRTEQYYDYAEGAAKLAHNTALAILDRLEALGLISRPSLREVDCSKLVKYLEQLEASL